MCETCVDASVIAYKP